MTAEMGNYRLLHTMIRVKDLERHFVPNSRSPASPRPGRI